MDILAITHKEFNKGQRTATKKLVQAVIDNMDVAGKKPMNRNAICKKFRVCSNKITDMVRYIKAIKKGEDAVFIGVSGYTYRFNKSINY